MELPSPRIDRDSMAVNDDSAGILANAIDMGMSEAVGGGIDPDR